MHSLLKPMISVETIQSLLAINMRSHTSTVTWLVSTYTIILLFRSPLTDLGSTGFRLLCKPLSVISFVSTTFTKRLLLPLRMRINNKCTIFSAESVITCSIFSQLRMQVSNSMMTSILDLMPLWPTFSRPSTKSWISRVRLRAARSSSKISTILTWRTRLSSKDSAKSKDVRMIHGNIRLLHSATFWKRMVIWFKIKRRVNNQWWRFRVVSKSIQWCAKMMVKCLPRKKNLAHHSKKSLAWSSNTLSSQPSTSGRFRQQQLAKLPETWQFARTVLLQSTITQLVFIINTLLSNMIRQVMQHTWSFTLSMASTQHATTRFSSIWLLSKCTPPHYLTFKNCCTISCIMREACMIWARRLTSE